MGAAEVVLGQRCEANRGAQRSQLARKTMNLMDIGQGLVHDRADFRVVAAEPDTAGARGTGPLVDRISADSVVAQPRGGAVVKKGQRSRC